MMNVSKSVKFAVNALAAGQVGRNEIKGKRRAAMMLLAAMAAAPALLARANPIGPDFGGTWDATTGINNPTFTTFNNSATINTGVTVTLAAGSTLTANNSANARFVSGTGTFQNDGTLDFTAATSSFRLFNSAITLNNAGTFLAGDGTYLFYNGGLFRNTGTLHKSTGAGTLNLGASATGVSGNFINDNGTIRVDSGTLINAANTGGGSIQYAGANQTITVASGATFQQGDATTITFGGTWNGSGGGVVKWAGGGTLTLDGTGTFTLNIDDGNRADYTTGGVRLGGGDFRSQQGQVNTVINKGKFWFNLAARWQSSQALNLQNEGWLVWDITPSTENLRFTAANSELRNESGGVLDVYDSTSSSSNNNLIVLLKSGSTIRGKATATWSSGLSRIDIKNGATVQSDVGTLTLDKTYFNGVNGAGAGAISTLNFNVTVANGATLDIRNINASGITSIGAGTTLQLKGSGQFLNNTTNVLSGKLATVNGTLSVSESASLTPAIGGLTISSGGVLAGDGTIAGAVTVVGSVRPGNSIGQLNISNDVTWNGAASAGTATDWVFELGAASAADLLNITGNFNKNTTAGSNFRFNFSNSTATGTFKLVDWTGTTGFAASDFSYTNLGGGNTGSFQFNGTQLEFVVAGAGPMPALTITTADGTRVMKSTTFAAQGNVSTTGADYNGASLSDNTGQMSIGSFTPSGTFNTTTGSPTNFTANVNTGAATGVRDYKIQVDNGSQSATATGTLTVVDNRVVTATPVTFNALVGSGALTTATTLNSPGSDDNNTRIFVSNGSNSDISVTGGTLTSTSNFFDGTNINDGRTATLNYSTAGYGGTSGTLTLNNGLAEAISGATAGTTGVGYTINVGNATASTVTSYTGATLLRGESDGSTALESKTVGNGSIAQAIGIDANVNTLGDDITMRWREKVTGYDIAPMFSDVVQIVTVDSNYILKMFYADDANESAYFLGRHAGGGLWVTAGNEGLYAKEGPYVTQTDVGRWGIDTTNNYVWAILNGGGDFAVIPEPTSLALLGLGAMGLLARRRTACRG